MGRTIVWDIGDLPVATATARCASKLDEPAFQRGQIHPHARRLKYASAVEATVRPTFSSPTTARASTCSMPTGLFGVSSRLHRAEEFEERASPGKRRRILGGTAGAPGERGIGTRRDFLFHTAPNPPRLPGKNGSQACAGIPMSR